jgi:transposase
MTGSGLSWRDGGMRPTAYRRNARGPRDRQAFEGVRMQAGALFAAGHSQAEVAHQLGVARQNVSRWHAQRQAGGLRRALGGQKATLLWDGLPAHRSRAMHAWRCQRSWLVVEPLPAYAPDLNPVEPLWSSLKGVELANLAGDTLDDVIAAAERGIQRIRHTHHLPFSFLRYCGLSLW